MTAHQVCLGWMFGVVGCTSAWSIDQRQPMIGECCVGVVSAYVFVVELKVTASPSWYRSASCRK